MTVDVVKGGAIRGMEIAAVQFTNDGTAACTITGTPTVVLLRGGGTVGTRSRPNGATVRPYLIPPGDYAESIVRVESTCNAPLSDSMRVRTPSRNGATGTTVTKSITLRACALRMAPAGEPS